MKALKIGYTLLCPECENVLYCEPRRLKDPPFVKARCNSPTGGFNCSLRDKEFTIPLEYVEIGEPV